MRFISQRPEDTERLGERLAAVARPGDVVLLTGDLGAGKTRFSKGVGRGLGVQEPITSPTFNILLVHEGTNMPLFHFDLYRLEDASQLEDIDYFGTLEDEGLSLVEWGDRFPQALPVDALTVDIRMLDDQARELEVSWTGPRSEYVAHAWAGEVEVS